MENISFDDFKKIEIKIGKIISAEKVEGSDKLLRLGVDFGLDNTGQENGGARVRRQIIAGVGKVYGPDDLIGKLCPFVFNLEPKMLKGLESLGMILCPSNLGEPVLLHPDKEIPAGSQVK